MGYRNYVQAHWPRRIPLFEKETLHEMGEKMLFAGSAALCAIIDDMGPES